MLNGIKSRFVRNAGAISGGAAVVQVIAFSASPLLTRLYGPEPFGVLALFVGFVTFAAAAASLHYEMAIALPKEDEKGAALTILAVMLAFVTGLLSIIVFAPGSVNLVGRLGYRALVPYWWMLPLTILGTGLQQALTLWHLRRHRFGDVGQNGILQSLSQNGIQIILGLGRLQSFGLLAGLVFSRFLAGVALFSRRLKADKALFRAGTKRLREVALEYKSFPSIGLMGAILHIACFQLPAFILADLYGAEITGWYMVQDRVLSVPLAILAQGIASVFYVNAAKLAIEDPEGLKLSYFKTLGNLTLAGIIPTVLLLILGPWVFKVIFGARWETAGEYARILAIPTFLRFVAGPLFRCLTILKRQSWIFVWDGIGLLILLSGSSYLSTHNGGGEQAMVVIASAISITYAGLLTAAAIAVLNHARNDSRLSPHACLPTPVSR
jgi:O-antigen/teichoic acid export membrane protein